MVVRKLERLFTISEKIYKEEPRPISHHSLTDPGWPVKLFLRLARLPQLVNARDPNEDIHNDNNNLNIGS